MKSDAPPVRDQIHRIVCQVSIHTLQLSLFTSTHNSHDRIRRHPCLVESVSHSDYQRRCVRCNVHEASKGQQDRNAMQNGQNRRHVHQCETLHWGPTYTPSRSSYLYALTSESHRLYVHPSSDLNTPFEYWMRVQRLSSLRMSTQLMRWRASCAQQNSTPTQLLPNCEPIRCHWSPITLEQYYLVIITCSQTL